MRAKSLAVFDELLKFSLRMLLTMAALSMQMKNHESFPHIWMESSKQQNFSLAQLLLFTRPAPIMPA